MMLHDFAAGSHRFDHDPDDDELVWLLGEKDYPGHLKVVKTAQCLIVAPGLIPMKFIVPWALFTGAVISAMPWIAPYFGWAFEGPMAWGVIIMMWLLIIPAFLFALTACNRQFDQREYFRVDKIQRNLELPREGLVFLGDHIIAVTELSKWCVRIDTWEWTRQTGVLLKSSEGQIEQRLLVQDIPSLWWSYRLADQIAAVLHVPVRRLGLNFRESRNLMVGK